MRALVVDHSARNGISLADVPEPVPADNQALIKVEAASVNYGEVSLAAGVVPHLERPPAGFVLGGDAAGVVVRRAADGSGPPAGARVVTLGAGGAWAERRAVNTDLLGVVPASVDLGEVSTVPIAGLTALRALHRVGTLLGRRILVTGSTGGVGRFAIQLARQAGAYVIAVTGDPDRQREGLIKIGAHEVVDSARSVTEPLHGIIDMVGGDELVAGFARLAEHGTLVAVGHAAGQPENFSYGALFGDDGGHDRSLVTFHLTGCTDLAPDLRWLAESVGRGSLDPQIAWRGKLDEADQAFSALLNRTLRGKAVIDIV